jgi:hypothetical protein
MDAVIRPVNDQFLHQVAFPAFKAGVVDATAGIEILLERVRDEGVRNTLELILDHGREGSFFTLDAARWLDAVYRLLFCEWSKEAKGWRVGGESVVGYAGDWHETLHLALMLEDPSYPYWNERGAAAARNACIELPGANLGIASLVCGLWDPFPSFPPDQVLSTVGRGWYRREAQVAVADWSYRPAKVVEQWSKQLSTKLGRLLKRERARIHPLEMPEEMDILDFWMGQLPEPPLLTVAFSGLGQQASDWVRDIGLLVRQVRSAAAMERGLTATVAARGSMLDRGL